MIHLVACHGTQNIPERSQLVGRPAERPGCDLAQVTRCLMQAPRPNRAHGQQLHSLLQVAAQALQRDLRTQAVL